MKSAEFITEGLNHPIIVVDVQPAYSYGGNQEAEDCCDQIIKFVNKATGPVLMFVNAEQDGLTEDTIPDIKQYWEKTIRGKEEEYYDEEEYVASYNGNNAQPGINWNRFTIVDKGFGYFRSWQSFGISDSAIIKVIRLLYQNKISDSRQLFSGDESEDYAEKMQELLGVEYKDSVLYDPLIVDWISVAQLKRFSGAYLVGGGRDECLWEVKVLMNAFNIRYRMIDSLIYG
jgi:hypothetical protein